MKTVQEYEIIIRLTKENCQLRCGSRNRLRRTARIRASAVGSR